MPKKKVSKSAQKTKKNKIYEHRAKIIVFFIIGVILASFFVIAFVGIEDLFMFLGGENLNQLGNYINNPSY